MQFTHEHREIQKTLKRFIDEEINPHVDEWEAAEIFPAHEVFKKMGNLGLLGLCKPEEYGGQGLDYSYSLAMAEALGHIHCGGVPMAIGVLTVLGPSESRVSGPAPSDAAIAQAVTVAVSTPAISPASTGHAMRLKVGRHRYNGTAMATVAGPSSHWMKPAPRK